MHQHLSACQSVSAASINRALLAEIIESIFVYFFLSLLSVHFLWINLSICASMRIYRMAWLTAYLDEFWTQAQSLLWQCQKLRQHLKKQPSALNSGRVALFFNIWWRETCDVLQSAYGTEIKGSAKTAVRFNLDFTCNFNQRTKRVDINMRLCSSTRVFSCPPVWGSSSSPLGHMSVGWPRARLGWNCLWL